MGQQGPGSILEPYASDGLGAYFSRDSFYVETVGTLSQFNPQIQNPTGNLLSDTLNYQKFTGYFTAKGGEKVMTLGNFKTNEETNYSKISSPKNIIGYGTAIYIDDVSVRLVPPEGLNLNLGPDTVLCDTSQINLSLSAQEGFEHYLWSTGDTTRSITVSEKGTYWVRGDFGCGYLYDTITVSTLPPPPPATPFNDTTICHQKPFSFFTKGPDGYAAYHWSNGENKKTNYIQEPGQYIVTGTHPCTIWTDTLSVSVFDPPFRIISPAADTSICMGDSITFEGPKGFAYYDWNTGSKQQKIYISKKGNYSLKAKSHEGCIVSDSVSVNVLHPPKLPLLPEDSVTCQGVSVPAVVSKQPDYNSIVWANLSHEDKNITKTGVYTVNVSNACFHASDSISVTFLDCTPFIPNLFTPNNDDKNDSFQIITSIERPLTLEAYNRWGQRVFRSEEYKNNWKATNLPNGIYFYNLTDHLLNKHYQGTVQITR